MKIFFYKSALCPRCMLAGRTLSNLKIKFPGMEIEELDVTVHPLRAWQDGIRLIPAIRSGNKIISGLFLGSREIREFLEQL